MEIRNVMTKKVYTLDENSTILDACILFRNKNIGFVPIVRNKKVLGVLSDRDLVLALSNNKKLSDKLKDIMKKKVITLSEFDSVAKAQELMGYYQIKRLIITRNEELIGVLSLADLIQNNDLCDLYFDTLSEITYDYKKSYKVPELDLKVDDFNL